jgi:hypothetical protein
MRIAVFASSQRPLVEREPQMISGAGQLEQLRTRSRRNRGIFGKGRLRGRLGIQLLQRNHAHGQGE